MKLNKEYITYVIVFFIVLTFGILAYLDLYACPFYFITGIPCPMCGMTRAFFSVFKLDFKSSFYFHALWPVVMVVLPTYIFLIIKKIKINKKLENTISIIIACMFLGYYIFRHIIGSEIVEIHFHDSLIYKIYFLLFK